MLKKKQYIWGRTDPSQNIWFLMVCLFGSLSPTKQIDKSVLDELRKVRWNALCADKSEWRPLVPMERGEFVETKFGSYFSTNTSLLIAKHSGEMVRVKPGNLSGHL